MKNLVLVLCFLLASLTSSATIHVVNVWSGYYKFVDVVNFLPDITIQLGDTVQWLPLDAPQEAHSITSTNIPAGAATFDQIWQLPGDTFFQYVPQFAGLYEYECTPHAISNNMVGSITVIGPPVGIDNPTNWNLEFLVYPNPFSSVTTIKFENTKLETLKLKLYDLQGRLVRGISNITSDEVVIERGDLESGVYFIELSSQGVLRGSGKMVVEQ